MPFPVAYVLQPKVINALNVKLGFCMEFCLESPLGVSGRQPCSPGQEAAPQASPASTAALLQVVLNYNGTSQELVAVPGRKLNWALGHPPPDTPECGFDNEDPACNQGDCLMPSRPRFWRQTVSSPASGVRQVPLSHTEGFLKTLLLPFSSLHPSSWFSD